MNNTQNFIHNHQKNNLLKEGIFSTLKTIVGTTKIDSSVNIGQLKNKITDSILAYFNDNQDVESFDKNKDDLRSDLYPIFTNTDFKNSEFEEYYENTLQKNYKNLPLDKMREAYADFRSEISRFATDKKYNTNIQYLHYVLISPAVKTAPQKKMYITLNNTSLKNFKINLNFIKKLLMNPPSPELLMFKIPFTFDKFVMSMDNFIYYFVDVKFANDIVKYINQIPHIKADRANFMRSEFGKDKDGSSDTQLVLEEFVTFLSDNYDEIAPSINGDIMNNKAGDEYKNMQQYFLEVLLQISQNAAHRK